MGQEWDIFFIKSYFLEMNVFLTHFTNGNTFVEGTILTLDCRDSDYFIALTTQKFSKKTSKRN